MFVIGALPAVLALWLRRLLPESPRWLASRGAMKKPTACCAGSKTRSRTRRQAAAADPRQCPAGAARSPPGRKIYSRGLYLKRTLSLWSLWFCTYLVGYGLTGWLPSIYRTVYKLPAFLKYSVISALIGTLSSIAVAFLIDKTGRKPWFATALLLASVPLFLLWETADMTPIEVVARVAVPDLHQFGVDLARHVHCRKLSGAFARPGRRRGRAWLRIASMIGPLIVGFFLPHAGLGAVFAIFGVAAVLGSVVCTCCSPTRNTGAGAGGRVAHA